MSTEKIVLTKELESIYNGYYANNGKKLNAIVDKILGKFGGISQSEYADFYSIANSVMTDIALKKRYDGSQSFEGYLYSCLSNKIKTEITARNRYKRMADRNTVSMDTPIDDETESTVGDFLCSNFDVHEEVFHDHDDSDEKVEEYLSKLSTVERKIVEMLMKDIQVKDIKEQLGLSNRQYDNHMMSIRQNKAVRLFNKNGSTLYKKQEEKKMVVDNKSVAEIGAEIMEQMLSIDTTDSYRTDKIPLGSLLDDKACGMIDCEYISQRQPFQWTQEQVNKYLTRVLNNQPIPEIVICELIRAGVKISYLIDGLQRLTYAEEFKEGRIKIGAKGAEFVNVQYKEVVKNEDGTTSIEVRVINLVGKRYEDLPKFLQKRFDNFNITVTRFFNCTEEMVDYHIRNYNNHTSMTKSQYAITNVGNVTSENIKGLSENHPFFKNVINCTTKGKKNGTLEEVVCKTVMTMFHLDDWKKEILDTMKYLDENSNNEEFEQLKDNLDDLAVVAEPFAKELKDLFSTTNTHIWLALYNKAVDEGISTNDFIEFMKSFSEELHSDNADEDDFIRDTYKSRSTKDKKVVVNKVNGLFKRLCDFCGVITEKNGEEDCVETDITNENDAISKETYLKEETSIPETNVEDAVVETVVVPTVENKTLTIADERLIDFLNKFKKSDLMSPVNDEETAKKLAFKSLMMYCDKDISGMSLQDFIDSCDASDDDLDDLDLLKDMLDMWTLEVDSDCELLEPNNIPELLRVVKYINDFDINDDMVSGWLKEYSSNYITRVEDSASFYNDMIDSLNHYVEKHDKKVA